MTIFELADLLDVEISVHRYPNKNGRWCAHFRACEVREGFSILVSVSGNGTSPERAITDYISKIEGQRLVFYAMSPELRREFVAPKGLTL